MGPLAQLTLQLFGNSDAATHHDDIDVVGRTFEENVANITANHIAFDTHRVGYMAYLVEDFLIQYLGQSGVGIQLHS